MARPTDATNVTAGLKWAADTGAKITINTNSIAAVAMVLQRSASATSCVKRSAMIPEPTTAAINAAVPSASAAILWLEGRCSAGGLADVIEFVLRRQPAQTLQRKIAEKIEPGADLPEGLEKESALLDFAPLKGGRI